MSKSRLDKIRVFRNKHERELRRIVTGGVAVSAAIQNGNELDEEPAMNDLTGLVLDLVDQARAENRRQKPSVIRLASVREIGGAS